MRLYTQATGKEAKRNRAFARALLGIGEGRTNTQENDVIKPKHLHIMSFSTPQESRKALINFVYEHLETYASRPPSKNADYLQDRCILAPLRPSPPRLLNRAAKPNIAAQTRFSSSTGAAKHSNFLATHLSAAIPIPNLASG
ncbi:hypothetical protein PGT21_021802 [Puccinia graminis f. sp. tritici]|uniref:Uncharacterized protein n=1 Tax=Puccinia graminis f. sp. tritici TaxID=56615 RepID=A0A5B0MNA2_PUCGR|nr:hypothetical protein PGT21_021802 [Puccinia graminis f. sp. tritici]